MTEISIDIRDGTVSFVCSTEPVVIHILNMDNQEYKQVFSDFICDKNELLEIVDTFCNDDPDREAKEERDFEYRMSISD